MHTHLYQRYLKPAALAVALIALPAQAQDGQMQMPPAQVEVVTAAARQMAPQMDVTGTIISLHDSRIAAEVEGPLLWIADVGTAVQEGDVIARMDTRLLDVAFKRAEANLKRLEADLKFREADVQRFRELAAKDNASKARLDEVTAQAEMTRQGISDARASYERAKGDLDRATIRAPFPGHVVQRLASKGEYITVGEDVVRLVDTRNIEVAMPAPIGITPFLKEGAMVEVKSEFGTRMLPIRTVVPVGDQVSRMVEVRLSADADDWVVSTPVKISLPKGSEVTAIAVPRDALVIKGGSVYLYKISADNKAERVTADIAATVGLWVGLKSGVDAGDKVVVRGAERLQPGQSVAATPHTGLPAANR